MKRGKSKKIQDTKEIKLAMIIMVFASLIYVSPAIWARFDKPPVIAAEQYSNGVKSEPKPEYIIASFVRNIDNGDLDSAMQHMDQNYTKYDSTLWKIDFSNIYFMKLRTSEFIKEDGNKKTYLLTLSVRLKQSRIKSAWENGTNTRLITLVNTKDEGWKIAGIEKE